MLLKQTIYNISRAMTELKNFLPEYNDLRIKSAVVIIKNINKLNHYNFPHDFFRKRIFEKNDLLTIPDPLYGIYMMAATNFLRGPSLKSMEKFAIAIAKRECLRINLVSEMIQAEIDKRNLSKYENLYRWSFHKFHYELKNFGVDMDGVHNLKLLTETLLYLIKKDKEESYFYNWKMDEKDKIKFIRKYIKEPDNRLLEIANSLIYDEFKELFNYDITQVRRDIQKIKEDKRNLVSFLTTYWDKIPPNSIKGISPAKLPKMSNAKFIDLVDSFSNFLKLNPDGVGCQNPHVIATFCATKKKTQLVDMSPKK